MSTEMLQSQIDYLKQEIDYLKEQIGDLKGLVSNLDTLTNWNDAPEWAQWIAMDANGTWFWYETEPFMRTISWQPVKYPYRYQEADRPKCNNWKTSKRQRP